MSYPHTIPSYLAPYPVAKFWYPTQPEPTWDNMQPVSPMRRKDAQLFSERMMAPGGMVNSQYTPEGVGYEYWDDSFCCDYDASPYLSGSANRPRPPVPIHHVIGSLARSRDPKIRKVSTFFKNVMEEQKAQMRQVAQSAQQERQRVRQLQAAMTQQAQTTQAQARAAAKAQKDATAARTALGVVIVLGGAAFWWQKKKMNEQVALAGSPYRY